MHWRVRPSSIEFRDEMAQIGVHIVLSLPNGTACTAEMDQLFEKFKPEERATEGHTFDVTAPPLFEVGGV